MKLKEKIKSLKRTQNGITLIALVVTIVVLLILAAISINLILGDNGIFSKANDAKNRWAEAEENEQAGLESLANKIDELSGKSKTQGNLEKGKQVTGQNYTWTEGEGSSAKTAIIPAGFCIVKDKVDGSGNITDENNIENGLVISDIPDDDLDNSKHGNQFVWIPVEDYTKFHLIEGYYNGSLDSMLPACKEAGSSDTVGQPISNNVAGTQESKAMYKSVQDNGGFYIARFEAGLANTTTSTETNDLNKQTQDGSILPVSQKGVGVWNFIPWGGTTAKEASDGLQGNDLADGAVKVARKMYEENSSVHSTLCYGVQWDAVMNYIDPGYVNGAATGFVKDSSGMGNYSGSIAVTGSNDNYEQKHIYDLAGNVHEWTMEAVSTNYRVNRGGNYSNIGTNDPASQRGYGNPDFSNYDLVGFRQALYL